ncbi:MAG: FAD-dependent oxidoreductase, partial [Polyangiaceae bacterium]|nr:FAD-dependent oxidoreductase [Polyangiaceae bacterium]
MAKQATDVLVVGGGVMGCAVALRLAQAGLRPTVLERSIPGAEASSVAAGILGPAMEATADGPMLRLGIESRERHAALAEELRTSHGIDVGFRRSGLLAIALDEAEATALRARASMLEAAGISARLLDAAETRAIEPGCNAEVLLGLELPDEAQLDPRALLPALSIAAERAGATFRTGSTVRGILRDGDRVRGVSVDDGNLEAPRVVVAAGSWTTLVPGLDLPASTVHPVRGQIVATRTRPPVFRRIVFGAGGYVVTRPDGRVLCGSTVEHVGFQREVTV